MSFEGYYQRLCKKGHQSTQDALSSMYCGDIKTCPDCGEKFVWENLVDVTNGSFEGNKRIDGYVELKVASIKSCSHCGKPQEVTYKIPKTKRRI